MCSQLQTMADEDHMVRPQTGGLFLIENAMRMLRRVPVKQRAPLNSSRPRITRYPHRYVKKIGRARTNQENTVYICTLATVKKASKIVYLSILTNKNIYKVSITKLMVKCIF